MMVRARTERTRRTETGRAMRPPRLAGSRPARFRAGRPVSVDQAVDHAGQVGAGLGEAVEIILALAARGDDAAVAEQGEVVADGGLALAELGAQAPTCRSPSARIRITWRRVGSLTCLRRMEARRAFWNRCSEPRCAFARGATVLVAVAALGLVLVAAAIGRELLSIEETRVTLLISNRMQTRFSGPSRARIAAGRRNPAAGPPAGGTPIGAAGPFPRRRRGGERPLRSPGSRPRGTPNHGSITILRERISKWVLIDILNFFHRLSTVICKIHLALIRHICSIMSGRRTGRTRTARYSCRKDMRS